MPDKSLEHAEPRAIFADERRGLVGQNFLIGMGLEELPDPKPTSVTARLLGRQRMIGADHLVAVGDVGARPQEQRPIATHVLQEPVVAIGHYLNVLGGYVVGYRQHLIIAVADDDLAIVL